MSSIEQQEENKNIFVPSFKFKTGEHSLCFKQIYNDYLNQQKNKHLELELICNPNKLFFEDIFKKKKEYDMKKENMNILTDLFDGKIIDIDQQKYLNTNSKNSIRFKTKSTKISQYLLFKSNGKFNNNKKKIIHKSFSQNIFSNNPNKKKLQFPKIIINENSENKIIPRKKSLVINTNTFDEKIKRSLIKSNIKLTMRETYFMNKHLRIFNQFKTKYYNKLNLLTEDSKKLSKNLSNYSIKRISHD